MITYLSYLFFLQCWCWWLIRLGALSKSSLFLVGPPRSDSYLIACSNCFGFWPGFSWVNMQDDSCSFETASVTTLGLPFYCGIRPSLSVNIGCAYDLCSLSSFSQTYVCGRLCNLQASCFQAICHFWSIVQCCTLLDLTCSNWRVVYFHSLTILHARLASIDFSLWSGAQSCFRLSRLAFISQL